jgi:hypothetical protein
MKNVQAEAIICLYNNSFTERDYYIVGDEIYISKPGPISELDAEDIEAGRLGKASYLAQQNSKDVGL